MNLALWVAAATGAQVGAATVASRYAVAEIGPVTLAMLRYAVGVLVLLPLVARALRRERFTRPPLPDLAAMAALGIGQFGVLIALLNFGLRTLSAAEAALIFSLFPLLTMGLAAALGRERVTPALLLGVLVSIGGVGLSLVPRLQGWRASGLWGEAAVLAAAGTGAACSVLYRPYLRRYPVLPVSAFAMLASVAALALLALAEAWPTRLPAVSGTAWAAVAFIGLSSGLGYWGWLYALKHESPTRVTVFLSLNPLAAGLLGWAFLGESPHAVTWAGVALIAAGLWLATRSPDNRRP